MNDDLENRPEIEMLSQPLMTDEGFVNPACINELNAAIAAMKPTHERLSSDLEWTTLAWTFPQDIVGAFSMWACRLSPYGVPDGLENVCKYLSASIKTVTAWDVNNMALASLCDISRWLHEILMDQGVKEFDAWNVARNIAKDPAAYAARYDDDRRKPDNDFIDLHALLHNVCITIRTERREFKAFNERLESEQAATSYDSPPAG